MNPTSFMFGAVLFAFLFYITVKGDLAKWLGLLGLAGSAGAGSSGSSGSSGTLQSTGTVQSTPGTFSGLSYAGIPSTGQGPAGILSAAVGTE